MNSPKRTFALVLTLPLFLSTAYGWEVSTHARLTKQAYLRAKLGEGFLKQGIGIREGLNLSYIYFDFQKDHAEKRIASERLGSRVVVNQERPTRSNLPDAGDAGVVHIADTDTYRHSAIGWLMRGAIREDDLGVAKNPIVTPLGIETRYVAIGDDPHDDPYAPPYLWRVMRHFYDPLNDSGFRVNCLSLFKAVTGDAETVTPDSYAGSPSWALGVDNEFADQPIETTGRRNHFTVLDAREAMYRALTGTNRQGRSDIGPETMTGPEIRKAYWATTFRALGDVLHLLQDTSQPQHTRNDPHSGVVCFGDASAIESYIEARAKGEEAVALRGVGTFLDPKPLDYGHYPIPRFGRYSDYFSTAQRGPGTPKARVANGEGLADYSNRGFFTAGRNLGDTEYPLPVSNADSYRTDYIELDSAEDGPLISKVYIGDVVDTVQGIVESAALTSEGILNEPLGHYPGPSMVKEEFALTPANYDDDTNLLLPRAVAYGAGVLNYFFRGHFDLAADKFFALIDHSIPHSLNEQYLPIDSETGKVFGFTKFKIRIRNDTKYIALTGSSEKIPQEMTDGFLQAVIKFNLNHCYKPDLTGQFGPREFPEGGVAAQMRSVSTHSGCNGAVYVAGPYYGTGGRIPAATLQEAVERQDHVAVSKRVPIGPGQEIERVSRSDFRTINFDFRDDPIPINARDIKLQVLYRGKMGSGDYVEDDAIAVTTVDISEPSYITFTNSTDYVNVNGFFLSYSATVPTVETIVANLRSTGAAEDEAEADELEQRLQTLIDPGAPITEFGCEDSSGGANLVTAESLKAKRFIRVAALANTAGNTQLDLCRYTVATASGAKARRLSVIVASRVHEDYYDRDKDLFMFKEFPQFRGVVQKAGSPEYYDKFAGWSAVHNVFEISEDEFPPSEPPQKIENIPNQINATPSPVEIRCDYTWSDCSAGGG